MSIIVDSSTFNLWGAIVSAVAVILSVSIGGLIGWRLGKTQLREYKAAMKKLFSESSLKTLQRETGATREQAVSALTALAAEAGSIFVSFGGGTRTNDFKPPKDIPPLPGPSG